MIFIKSDSIRILLTYYKVHLDRIQGFEEKAVRAFSLFGLLADTEVKGRDQEFTCGFQSSFYFGIFFLERRFYLQEHIFRRN